MFLFCLFASLGAQGSENLSMVVLFDRAGKSETSIAKQTDEHEETFTVEGACRMWF